MCWLNKTQKTNSNWSTQVFYIVWIVKKSSTKSSCEDSLYLPTTCVFYTALRLILLLQQKKALYEHAVWNDITRDKHCWNTQEDLRIWEKTPWLIQVLKKLLSCHTLQIEAQEWQNRVLKRRAHKSQKSTEPLFHGN